MSSPKAGVHYPGNLTAVRPGFRTTRPAWTVSTGCGGLMVSAARTVAPRRAGDSRPAGGCAEAAASESGSSRERSSKDTRTPLTVWFEVAWLMAVTKNGISAASLQPLLGLGLDETTWAMCDKLRTAMGRTSIDLLSGDVEVDETFIGGVKTGGKRGRGAPGNVFVVIAVESKDKAFGRCRLQVVPKIDAVCRRTTSRVGSDTTSRVGLRPGDHGMGPPPGTSARRSLRR